MGTKTNNLDVICQPIQFSFPLTKVRCLLRMVLRTELTFSAISLLNKTLTETLIVLLCTFADLYVREVKRIFS